MSISWPNPMFDILLESSYRDDSNKWSNIAFGYEKMELSSIEVNFMHLIWSSGFCSMDTKGKQAWYSDIYVTGIRQTKSACWCPQQMQMGNININMQSVYYKQRCAKNTCVADKHDISKYGSKVPVFALQTKCRLLQYSTYNHPVPLDMDWILRSDQVWNFTRV